MNSYILLHLWYSLFFLHSKASLSSEEYGWDGWDGWGGNNMEYYGVLWWYLSVIGRTIHHHLFCTWYGRKKWTEWDIEPTTSVRWPFLPCSSFHAAVVVSRIIVTTSSPMILSNPPFISVWKETGALNYACSRELSDQISLYCLTSPTALVTSETFS